jgi:hypothetical protein
LIGDGTRKAINRLGGLAKTGIGYIRRLFGEKSPYHSLTGVSGEQTAQTDVIALPSSSFLRFVQAYDSTRHRERVANGKRYGLLSQNRHYTQNRIVDDG